MRPFVEHYDLIYADKDYAADIAAFEALVKGPLADLDVLEIGAGTGNQSKLLAPRVKSLTALEIDADFAALLQSALGSASNVRIVREPVEKLSGAFDAAAAFFHVLNYIDADAMPPFLAGVARTLKPGATFAADIWNAEAVLADPPRAEVREKHVAGKTIRQKIEPTLYEAPRRVRLHYDIAISGGAEPAKHFTEDIELSLCPRAELDALLLAAGFQDIAYHDYRRFPAPATPQSWRVWLSCRRR